MGLSMVDWMFRHICLGERVLGKGHQQRPGVFVGVFAGVFAGTAAIFSFLSYLEAEDKDLWKKKGG